MQVKNFDRLFDSSAPATKQYETRNERFLRLRQAESLYEHYRDNIKPKYTKRQRAINYIFKLLNEYDYSYLLEAIQTYTAEVSLGMIPNDKRIPCHTFFVEHKFEDYIDDLC